MKRASRVLGTQDYYYKRVPCLTAQARQASNTFENIKL